MEFERGKDENFKQILSKKQILLEKQSLDGNYYEKKDMIRLGVKRNYKFKTSLVSITVWHLCKEHVNLKTCNFAQNAAFVCHVGSI